MDREKEWKRVVLTLFVVQAAARGHGAPDGAGRAADESDLQHAGRRVRHHTVLPGQAVHQQAQAAAILSLLFQPVRPFVVDVDYVQ